MNDYDLDSILNDYRSEPPPQHRPAPAAPEGKKVPPAPPKKTAAPTEDMVKLSQDEFDLLHLAQEFGLQPPAWVIRRDVGKKKAYWRPASLTRDQELEYLRRINLCQNFRLNRSLNTVKKIMIWMIVIQILTILPRLLFGI